MIFRQLTLQVSLLIISILTLHAQSTNSRLDNFFIRKMKKSGRIGLQAAFISDGELTWKGSYGMKTYKTEDKVNDSTLFMIASTSKPVTALALMKLYDEGKVNLDEDINVYLPFIIRNPNHPDDKITCRMLLSHVGSIRDNWEMLEMGYTIEQGGDSPMCLEDFIKNYLLEGGKFYDKKKNFLSQAPGMQARYSNVGYNLIAYVVEKIANRPFNEFMAEEVFKPLKMNNTYWFLSEIPHQNLATPHNMPHQETEFKGTQVLKHFGYPGYASGQLRSTVSDYAQILKLMVNDGRVDGIPLVSSATMKEFLKIQYPAVNKWQAIAWNYNEFGSALFYLLMPRLPAHTGLDPGMATVVSFDPKTKSGMMIFSNSPTTTFYSEKIIYLDMMKRLYKEAKRQTNCANAN